MPRPAVVEPGRGFASIRRVDRNRAVNVTASIDPGATSADAVIADLNARILPEVLSGYPGVFYTFEGAMAEQRDALGGAAARLHARATDDLRVAGGAAAVLRAAADHHERHPVRAHRRGLGARLPGAARRSPRRASVVLSIPVHKRGTAGEGGWKVAGRESESTTVTSCAKLTLRIGGAHLSRHPPDQLETTDSPTYRAYWSSL